MSTPPQSTDMMNVLPDDILKHILSLLRTRDAFRTKFVSKSWVPLFESLNSLNIDSRDMFNYNAQSFFQFTNAVLLSPRHPLKAVTLFWQYSVRKPCFKLNRFVEAAKRRGVKELDIYWYRGVSSPTIFCSKTLVVLKLWDIFVLSMVGFSIDLPSLKTLVLRDILFYDLDDLMKLVYGCPKLEDLTTNGVRGTLAIMSTRYFGPLSSLIKANTRIFEVQESIHVEFLTLSKLECSLPNKQINSYYKDFRLFENLIELRIFWFYRDIYDGSQIVKMLFSCPKLEALYIKKERMEYAYSKTTNDWKYPDHVPECVRSHLTTCNIINYQATEADFRFAIYILKNARLLEDMTIHVHSSSNTMQRSQFVENLSSFPRISPTCKLLLK